MRYRKRIDSLAPSEIERIRDAFRALMTDSDGGKNYAFWASIHKACCPHHSALFLPWHRAYILAFENALRATPGNSDVTLPYWDWTVVRQIPELVQQDPLRSDRFTNSDPDKLPTAASIGVILQETVFLDFGGAGCFDGGSGGDLENAHGLVHTWVGPVMGSSDAAFDPLFWFHHSYVDRVWARWQESQSDALKCLDKPLQGIPGTPLVRDVLDMTKLDYEYVDSSKTIANELRIEGEVTLRLEPQFVGAAGVRLVLNGVTPLGTGEPPAELEVYLGADPRPAVRISLFAASHGAARDHTGFDCEHMMGAPSVGLAVNAEFRSDPTSLRLVPRWPPTNRSRTGISIQSLEQRAR